MTPLFKVILTFAITYIISISFYEFYIDYDLIQVFDSGFELHRVLIIFVL